MASGDKELLLWIAIRSAAALESYLESYRGMILEASAVRHSSRSSKQYMHPSTDCSLYCMSFWYSPRPIRLILVLSAARLRSASVLYPQSTRYSSQADMSSIVAI